MVNRWRAGRGEDPLPPPLSERVGWPAEGDPAAVNIVAVDFDGVLHDFSAGWTGPEPEGRPLPGAQAFIKGLFFVGLQPVIHSSRAGDAHSMACIIAWLERWGFPEMRVVHKQVALANVDDLAVRCDPAGGVDFQAALAECCACRGGWPGRRRAPRRTAVLTDRGVSSTCPMCR